MTKAGQAPMHDVATGISRHPMSGNGPAIWFMRQSLAASAEGAPLARTTVYGWAIAMGRRE